MKRKIALFLCMVMILTTMSGMGPIKVANAAAADYLYSEKEEVTDYAYSFAVVGDTQIVTEYDDQNDTTCLDGLYDWILTNKEEKKIAYVLGLGDITDNNSTSEWQIAKNSISKLNGEIPYSLVRGNHDLVGRGSGIGKWMDLYTYYLGTNYRSQLENGGFYSDDDIWNSWRTFTVEDVDYLILGLDWGASDEVLSWASSIIEEHPNYNVIITTHGYLHTDGNPIGTDVSKGGMTADTKAANNGEDMWNKLVSKHENIVLVLSGHDPCEDIVVSQKEGENGNIVTQMLIDPQDVDEEEIAAGEKPLGAVAMLYFSEDGRHIDVEYIATARDEQYYKENNQFRIDDIHVVSKELDSCERVAIPYSAEYVTGCLDGTYDYPTRDGYLFAGWFTNKICDEDSLLRTKKPTGTVYALFVPEHVLSVKAQISTDLINDNSNTASIRFVSSIDSLLYKEVGFDISYTNSEGKTVSANSASKKAYRKLYVMNSTNVWEKTPEGTFCGTSTYFKTCILKNISVEKYYDTVFTVQPYWITMDGHKVYGEPAEKSLKQGVEETKVTVNVVESTDGTVSADKSEYNLGDTVTLTATPTDANYACSALNINGWEIQPAYQDGEYVYSFVAMKQAYTIEPVFMRKLFVENNKWDLTMQYEGVVSLPGGGTASSSKNKGVLTFYDKYTDVDLTLKNVKENGTGDTHGRTDVLFEFDLDGDGTIDKTTSFGIVVDGEGKNAVQAMGSSGTQIMTKRPVHLFELSESEGEKYLTGEGVELRLVRLGTDVYIYVEGTQRYVFDLTQNESGVTAETEATISFRHYDAVVENGSVVFPFEISDTVDQIFAASTGKGTWDLTDKYNGVVKLNATGNTALPFADLYKDIDITLPNVKEYSYVKEDGTTTVYGRTDIQFEFDTNNDGSMDKSTSVGLVRESEDKIVVETLGTNSTKITSTRQLEFCELSSDEREAYKTGDGVELRVIRSGTYLYVYIEGRQVGVFDLAQNSSGVTADMEAKVSLRHYDVVADEMSFPFKVSDKVEEVTLDIVSNENGDITTNEINLIANNQVTQQNSTKHFMGETVVLQVTPDDGYACTEVLVNEDDTVGELVTNDDGTYSYSFVANAQDNSIEFVISDTLSTIFTTEGATGTWDVTNESNGVVSVDSTSVANVKLPLARKYTDIDFTLTNVKENGTETKHGRTDVLFEFDIDGNGTIDKSTSFGTTVNGYGDYVVQTLGNSTSSQWISKDRNVDLCKLSESEIEKYSSGEGVELRLVRLGTNVYIYVEGTQRAVFDLTQNNSGVTADTKAKVSLRHYDIKGEFEFPFAVTDKVQKVTLDIAKNANGTVTATEIQHFASTTGVVQESKRHFVGEKVVLTVTPNEGYVCEKLKVNGKTVTVVDGKYTFVATEPEYVIEASYAEQEQ